MQKNPFFIYICWITLKTVPIHSTPPNFFLSFQFSHTHLPQYLSLPNSLEILPHTQSYVTFILLIHLLSS